MADFFKANGTHFSDHQRVGVGLGKAILGEVDKPKGCHGWSTKQIEEFQKIMKRWSSNRSENSEIAVEYTDLCNKMKEACMTVSNTKPVARSRGSITWETFVKGMERLARRNPKIFFRSAKAFHLFNPPPPGEPAPYALLDGPSSVCFTVFDPCVGWILEGE